MRYVGSHIAAKELVSVAYAAEIIGVSKAYLYRLIRQNRLDAYVVGERLMIRLADIQSMTRTRKAS